MSDQSPAYGTVYVTASQIRPRCHRMDDGQIVIHLTDGAGVGAAYIGTSDEIIAACTRIATAASDSEEPRFEFGLDGPTLRECINEPDPGAEHGPTEQTTVTVSHRFPAS